MQEITLELALLGLLYCFLSIIGAVECKEGTCEVLITNYVWFQTHALLVFTQSLLVLPKFVVNIPQVAGRYHVLRIAFGPKLVNLAGLL